MKKILVALLLLAAPSAAQELTLTTTYASGNGFDGNMFDVTAKLTPIKITRVDAHFDSGNVSYEVYYVPGGWSGNEFTASAWTLAGSGSVTGGGDVSTGGQSTPLPSQLDIEIPAGQTYGIYVTNTGGASPGINYTNGVATGGIYVENADLTVREGLGGAYPFNLTWSPRVWNGTIYYIRSGLVGTPGQISLGSGGSQVLALDVGTSYAFDLYFVLGSVTGTVPGITYTGINIPLNPDPYLFFTANNPNTPLLNGSSGTLNSLGQATAVLTLAPGLDPALAGVPIHHAGIVLDPLSLGLKEATIPAPLVLVP